MNRYVLFGMRKQALGFLVALAAAVYGATYTWDGGGGTNQFWSSDANWNPDGAPPSPGDGTDGIVLTVSGNSRAAAVYHVQSITLGGGHQVFFQAGAAVTTATWSTTGSSGIHVLDGGILHVKGNLTHVGWDRVLAVNTTGNKTGRLVVDGSIAVGDSVYDFVNVDGADDGTLVVQVGGTGNFYNRLDLSGGWIAVSGGGELKHLNMSGGRMTFGAAVGSRGAATVDISGGRMSIAGNLAVQNGAYGGGNSAPAIWRQRGNSVFELTGARQLLLGNSNNSSPYNNGPGIFYLEGSAFLDAPQSEMRIGANSYSDGIFVQSGGTAEVATVFVGYHPTPNPANPVGCRGFGTFILSNGLFRVRDFYVGGRGTNAVFTQTGGLLEVRNGSFRIRSTNEMPNVSITNGLLRFVAGTNVLEAASRDLGLIPEGWATNHALFDVEVSGGVTLTLTDLIDNVTSDGGAAEAVYLNTLIMGDYSTLNLNGLNLYCRTMELGTSVTFNGGTPRLLRRGGTVIQVR